LTILVDTSVWIRYLANQQPFLAELDRLLATDKVDGHELVYGELLIGDSGGRAAFLAKYERLRQVPIIPHRDVVAFVRAHRLHGRGIGWIDVHLLASAMAGRVQLWTADRDLAELAKEFGVAYKF
jgi:predicted nucleic acid-binding protein